MKLALYLTLLIISFCSGYGYGIKHGKFGTMRSQLDFYHKEGKFKNAIQNMSDYDMCRALGGMRDKCRIFKP